MRASEEFPSRVAHTSRLVRHLERLRRDLVDIAESAEQIRTDGYLRATLDDPELIQAQLIESSREIEAHITRLECVLDILDTLTSY